MWFFKKSATEKFNYLDRIKDINYNNIYGTPAANHSSVAYEQIRNKNGYGIGSATIYNLQALFQNIQTGQSMQFSTVLKKISTTERIKANNYIHSIVEILKKTNKDMSQEATWSAVLKNIKDARTGNNSEFPKAPSGTVAVIAMIYAEFLKKEAARPNSNPGVLNKYFPSVEAETPAVKETGQAQL